ncbi:MAG: hypothetical protein LPK12_14280, partial [Rhodobacterales bacterium]|nr:hypothetical protein [Rhodobacterales bacterium]MDX5501108.1 hypothetical protein [Rhodobacterales bacterium]
PKSSNALLFLADLVAYSAYQALNLADHNYGVADHSYLLELHRKFFSDRETGQIGDYGLKIFKRNGISLDNRSLELVRRIYRKRKKQHQDHRQESDQDH